MKVSISYAKKHFYKLVEVLVDKQEKVIVITKYGKPVVQLSLTPKKQRIGVAKKEMEDFDISLESFNAIPSLEL